MTKRIDCQKKGELGEKAVFDEFLKDGIKLTEPGIKIKSNKNETQKEMDIRWNKQYKLKIEKYGTDSYEADFEVPNKKILIEVKTHKEKVKIDEIERDSFTDSIKKRGFKVFVIQPILKEEQVIDFKCFEFLGKGIPRKKISLNEIKKLSKGKKYWKR